MSKISAAALVVLAALTLGACSDSTRTETYQLEIMNAAGATMLIWWDDGTGLHSLSPLESGQEQIFEIVNPATRDITIVAETAAGTGTRTIDVTLVRNEVVRVVLTPI
jgi:hypothetical protein